MINSDLRNNWDHCIAYTRQVECVLIVTILALTIFVPSTHAQVPESTFERRQDAILEKQSELPAPPSAPALPLKRKAVTPPPTRAVPPTVVKERVIREMPAPITVPEATKADLQEMNRNMKALKKSMDQLNETLNKLAEALAGQVKAPQQQTK